MVPDDIFRKAVDAAKSVSQHAYAPYSKFPVGAAVITEDGSIITGCNVENASYGLTICAERNAVFHTVSLGLTRIVMVIVYTPTETPTAPCGACRQVINEFGPQAEIVSICDKPDRRLQDRLDALLKDAFGPRNLQK
ncbi:cytidine deaminase [Paludisphaera rhizosphaerae]|nr:cytidine deaminase [Paludisphaera rhizosphaerae]